MGQCQCLSQDNSRSQTNDKPFSSIANTPRTVYTPNKIRKKREDLHQSIKDDFYGEPYSHLFTTDVNMDDFQIIKVIGRGSFGKIYLVQKLDKTTGKYTYYALKALKKKLIHEKNQIKLTLQERKILIEVKHPFLVSMRYAFQSPDRLYFVLDYVNGGDLFYHLKKKSHFSEKEARFYGAELFLALEYLHKSGFIYRDMKPENILLDQDGHLRLTDFGLSKEYDLLDQKLNFTFCGTPQYLAPELIKKEGYTHLVDYWGLGIIMYEIVVGTTPFGGDSIPMIIQDILFTEFRPNSSFSKHFSSLLKGLLNKDPHQRLGNEVFGGAQTIKNHPFFQGIDWELLYQKKMKPLIKPKVKNEGSTKNIEGIYLAETIKNTPTQMHPQLLEKLHFDGFTYSEENLMLNNLKNPEQIINKKKDALDLLIMQDERNKSFNDQIPVNSQSETTNENSDKTYQRAHNQQPQSYN